MLYSNLAFPLLYRLTKLGDPIAKKVLKEEIAKRYLSGSSIVQAYLIREGYLRYLASYKRLFRRILKACNEEQLEKLIRYSKKEDFQILLKNPDSNFLQKMLNFPRFLINYEEMWVKYDAKPYEFVVYYDLGEQNGPFLSPKMFEEFYKPVYKQLFDTPYEMGCDFHLHCCGKINPIIPLLIEWGLDALELDSPRMTVYPELNQFRGKIMIWGCSNIQSIYTLGTPEEHEREVWHMIRNLGSREGGFGTYFYPQTNHIQAPETNINAFTNGLEKYGVYANIPEHWWTYPVVNKWRNNDVPPLPP